MILNFTQNQRVITKSMSDVLQYTIVKSKKPPIRNSSKPATVKKAAEIVN